MKPNLFSRLFGKRKMASEPGFPFGTGSLLEAKLELAKESARPRYVKAKDLAPNLTVAKGSQFLRLGRVHGIFNRRKAA